MAHALAARPARVDQPSTNLGSTNPRTELASTSRRRLEEVDPVAVRIARSCRRCPRPRAGLARLEAASRSRASPRRDPRPRSRSSRCPSRSPERPRARGGARSGRRPGSAPRPSRGCERRARPGSRARRGRSRATGRGRGRRGRPTFRPLDDSPSRATLAPVLDLLARVPRLVRRRLPRLDARARPRHAAPAADRPRDRQPARGSGHEHRDLRRRGRSRAAGAHARDGRVDWRIVAWMAPPSVAGAVLGALVADDVPERALFAAIALVLFWSGVDLALRPVAPRPRARLRVCAGGRAPASVIGALGGAVGVILGTLAHAGARACRRARRAPRGRDEPRRRLLPRRRRVRCARGELDVAGTSSRPGSPARCRARGSARGDREAERELPPHGARHRPRASSAWRSPPRPLF